MKTHHVNILRVISLCSLEYLHISRLTEAPYQYLNYTSLATDTDMLGMEMYANPHIDGLCVSACLDQMLAFTRTHTNMHSLK